MSPAVPQRTLVPQLADGLKAAMGGARTYMVVANTVWGQMRLAAVSLLSFCERLDAGMLILGEADMGRRKICGVWKVWFP